MAFNEFYENSQIFWDIDSMSFKDDLIVTL